MDSNTCTAAYVADYVVAASELVRSGYRVSPNIIDHLELACDCFPAHAQWLSNVNLRTPGEMQPGDASQFFGQT